MFFDHIEEAPPDPIFGLGQAFQADARPNKINLVVGIYKDEALQAKLLPAVRKAQEMLQENQAEYLSIDGLAEMIERLGPRVFGAKAWKEQHGRIYAAHTTGGTGALRIGAEFLVQTVARSFYVPNHTWPNHRSIVEHAGGSVATYPYYSRTKKGFDFEAMLQFLKNLSPKSIVILHACCHNPTGSDPTLEEWRQISHVMREKQLLPFFDFAYQGFGEDWDKDAAAVRLFLEEGHDMLIAYSCSKNFSMYCERVGALFVVDRNAAIKTRIGSQVKRIIRALYSNPPAHGARVVNEILKQETLTQEWLSDLKAVRHRLHSMRQELIQRLGKEFDYLKHHQGMFSFIDLDKPQVHRLIQEFGIYMTDNGRISIAGLNKQNIEAVVQGLIAVCAKR